MTPAEMMLWPALIATVSVCAASPAWAANNSRASVSLDRDVLELGDTFEYTVSVATDGNSNIRLTREPDFRPFSVIGRSQMPQFILRNGVAQRSLTITYRLRTRRIGQFDIAPPMLAVGNEQITAKQLKIKVVKQGEGPKKKGPSKTDAAYVEVTLQPKRAPYVGEQITLEYDLFMDSRQIDGQPHPPTEPSLDAFWIEDLSPKSAGTKQLVRLGSRFFEKIVLRKYALFPLRAGATTIEPMSVDILTGGFMKRQQRFAVTSEPIKLDVKPLPPNAPAGFYEGNVGNWNFYVTTDTRETRMGRAVTIRVTARGNGQPGRLQLPELPDIPGTRLASSEEKSNREVSGDQIIGEKTHTYALTPLEEGSLTIPGMRFSYFDPEAGEYRTKESSPIVIKVTQGELAETVEDLPEPALRRSGSSEDDMLSRLRTEMSGPRRDVSLGRAEALLHPESLLYRVALGLALLALFFLTAGPRLKRLLNRDTPERRQRHAAAQASKLLDTAQGEKGWDVVKDAVRVYATQVLGLASGHVTARELPQRARAVGVPEELAQQLGALLERCRKARYSEQLRADDAALAALVQEAREALKQLEALRKKKALSPAVTAMLFGTLALSLLTLSPGVAMAQNAAQQARPLVEQALKHQDARKWEQAASLWEKVDTLTPNEPDVLYNLGTTYMQQGKLPMARLVLERALLYEPQGRDISNNLDLVTRMIRVRAIENVRGRTQRVGVSNDFFWWDMARRITARALAILLLISVCSLIFVLLTRPRTLQPAVRDTLAIVGVLAALVMVASMAGWYARAQIMQRSRPAIILTPSPELREGPSAHAAKLGAAHPVAPGMRVPIEEARQGWTKVRLPDGASGWLLSPGLGEVK